MSYHSAALATFENLLGTMDHLASRAQDGGVGDEAMQAKLAEDMFPLARQIRFVCNLPGEAMNASSDVAFGSSDIDDETLAEARERIAGTRALITNWRAVELKPDAAPVVLSLANGMTFDLDTAGYARDWALPQFYFHLMTAYAILRAAGVPLGKIDYVGYIARAMRQRAD